MRWEGQRRSQNIDDRRGRGRTMAAGGGLGMLLLGLLYTLITGQDPGQLGGAGGGGGGAATTQEGPLQTTPQEEKQREMVEVVLAWTEDIWSQLFQRVGRTYEKPTLVFFRGQVQSDCGFASAQVGPFYCPSDKKIYIDLSFFAELDRRFKAPGDFAQAYVIAHEVGHHVQNLLGIAERVHRAERAAGSKAEANRLSVRLELQADFFAGVWAHHNEKLRHFMEPGDLEEAMRAAQAIGDDAIQKQAQGYVVPDSFTHGSSVQRVAWFRHGFATGDLAQGDVFDDALWNRVNPR